MSALDPSCHVCIAHEKVIYPGETVTLCPAHWDAWDAVYGDEPHPLDWRRRRTSSTHDAEV